VIHACIIVQLILSIYIYYRKQERLSEDSKEVVVEEPSTLSQRGVFGRAIRARRTVCGSTVLVGVECVTGGSGVN